MRFTVLLGVVVTATGAVLALFFQDLEFYWFQGGPLGVVLMIVGAFEIGEGAGRAKRRIRSGDN